MPMRTDKGNKSVQNCIILDKWSAPRLHIGIPTLAWLPKDAGTYYVAKACLRFASDPTFVTSDQSWSLPRNEASTVAATLTVCTKAISQLNQVSLRLKSIPSLGHPATPTSSAAQGPTCLRHTAALIMRVARSSRSSAATAARMTAV